MRVSSSTRLGQIWPIGVGIQRIAIRDGRFEYHGGSLPAPCLDALPQLTPAVESIAGLRGFVGVDFIWNSRKNHATILEINPRADDVVRRALPARSSRACWA